jgi:hypothetical protein
VLLLKKMKRVLAILVTLAFCGLMQAQNVFTVVYATSDDGFVNVRATPSNKGKILTKLYAFSHGLGNGVLVGKKGNWSKVQSGKITGWAYSKYVGTQTWYEGKGKPRLIATRDNTPIFGEDLSGEAPSLPIFATVKKGTIIADTFTETDDGEYYMLVTAHDNLFIKKKDAKIVK